MNDTTKQQNLPVKYTKQTRSQLPYKCPHCNCMENEMAHFVNGNETKRLKAAKFKFKIM